MQEREGIHASPSMEKQEVKEFEKLNNRFDIQLNRYSEMIVELRRKIREFGLFDIYEENMDMAKSQEGIIHGLNDRLNRIEYLNNDFTNVLNELNKLV